MYWAPWLEQWLRGVAFCSHTAYIPVLVVPDTRQSSKSTIKFKISINSEKAIKHIKKMWSDWMYFNTSVGTGIL